ncbi:hypothetical protein D9M70_460650 [compost metagenome]
MLRGGADDTFSDRLDARATAVDRDDQHVLLLADGLQRLIGANGGRLVDGVDHVDVGILLQKVFHRLAATFFVAVGDVVADDARIIFVADLVRILRVDAEAHHEALVAQDVDRRLRRRQIEEADLGGLGTVTHGGSGPLADELAGNQVVSGEGRIGSRCRIERRIERDHQKTGFLRLLDLIDDRLGVGGGDQDALGAIGDAGFDCSHLAVVVAVDLAGIGLQRHAEFLRLGGSTLLHLDEEGVGVGLGNEAGADISSLCRRGENDAKGQRAESSGKNSLLHEILPRIENRVGGPPQATRQQHFPPLQSTLPRQKQTLKFRGVNK